MAAEARQSDSDLREALAGLVEAVDDVILEGRVRGYDAQDGPFLDDPTGSLARLHERLARARCTCDVRGPEYDDVTFDPACLYHGNMHASDEGGLHESDQEGGSV